MRYLLRIAATLICLALFWSGCAEQVLSPPPTTKPAVGLDFPDIYDVNPNVGGCQAGALKPIERTKVLDYLNSIRRLHGLGVVVYDSTDNKGVTDAALIMLSNNTLNHTPPASYSCWTQSGATAASKSNLAAKAAFDTATNRNLPMKMRQLA